MAALKNEKKKTVPLKAVALKAVGGRSISAPLRDPADHLDKIIAGDSIEVLRSLPMISPISSSRTRPTTSSLAAI